MLHLGGVQVQSPTLQTTLFFETPAAMALRVFRDLKPRTPPPEVRVVFKPFASANSFIRLAEGVLELRITDVLEGAPSPILESLLYILIGKLYRREISGWHNERYRRYMNRRDMRRSLELLRQTRGRKFVSGPRGEHYDLEEMFEALNLRYFDGMMARPALGWSRQASRTTLGHYDPSHNAIILSRILDRAATPRLAVEYVLFHEMLHLRHPVDHRAARRRVHTRDFRAAERSFKGLAEAKEMLKRL